MNPTLICPVCKARLDRCQNGLSCARGHHFDRAAKGYTNLLLGSRAQHGDNAEMVAARRRFLDSGAYACLAKSISDALTKRVPETGCLLDAGCGEGYYTARIAEEHPALRICGIDVSKEAIRAAASRSALKRENVGLYVAGVYEMPFSDDAFDAVLSVFSPFADEEFRRTLKTGGHLISVIPGAKHLWDLKSVLYDVPYENEVADYTLDGFKLLEKIELHDRILLKTPEQIGDLFAMTPYYHRTPRQGHERLGRLAELETEIAFEVLVYRQS